MDDSRGHLIFACGPRLFGVPADRAEEVVSLSSLTRLPGAASFLLGVFPHRGEIFPLIDLASLTGNPLEARVRRAVLLRVPLGGLALAATRVAGVSNLDGPFVALGTTGIEAHLSRSSGAAVDVTVIEPRGLFDFVARGGTAVEPRPAGSS